MKKLQGIAFRLRSVRSQGKSHLSEAGELLLFQLGPALGKKKWLIETLRGGVHLQRRALCGFTMMEYAERSVIQPVYSLSTDGGAP